VMGRKENCASAAPESPEAANSAPEACLGPLELGVRSSEAGRLLYARYVRALALPCECVPFVDDED
jgi:hypothetical protein